MEGSLPILVDRTETTLTVSWSPSRSALVYEVQIATLEQDNNCAQKTSNIDWTTLSSTLKSNIVKKKNLIPSTAYIFRVRHKDRLGEWDFFSGPSDPFLTLAEGTPKMESGPIAQTIEADAVVLSWPPVEAAECYELQMADPASYAWATISSAIHQPTVRKKGLHPGTPYIFRVRPLFSTPVELEDQEGKYGQIALEWEFSPASPAITTPTLANSIRNLLPNTLIRPSGEQVSIDKLAGKVIALYCSAHWCGPCRKYTPQLSVFYQQMQNAQRAFEVIFISCDGDEASMLSYFQDMPWLAVPFDDEAREEILSKFEVKGVPRLIVMDKAGTIVAENAIQTGLTDQHVQSWLQGQAGPVPPTSPSQQNTTGCCGGGCK